MELLFVDLLLFLSPPEYQSGLDLVIFLMLTTTQKQLHVVPSNLQFRVSSSIYPKMTKYELNRLRQDRLFG